MAPRAPARPPKRQVSKAAFCCWPFAFRLNAFGEKRRAKGEQRHCEAPHHACTISLLPEPRDASISLLPVPKWRNWQTRMVQVHVPARVWGFESLLRHQLSREIYANSKFLKQWVLSSQNKIDESAAETCDILTRSFLQSKGHCGATHDNPCHSRAGARES